MHFLVWLGSILAGVALLMLGLLSVWKDLTARGPWEPPVVKDEENWSTLDS